MNDALTEAAAATLARDALWRDPPALAAGDSTPADPRLERGLAELTLIRRLRDGRTTWNRIGTELGMTGPQAKQHHKHHKRLTAQTRRAWYLQQNREVPEE